MSDSVVREEETRIKKSEQTFYDEQVDIGLEGNKSTYLRPSRNREMSSLDLKYCNSRSVSNVLLQES